MAIVQMKKVSLVILDSTRKASLKQLRKAGVLHLEAAETDKAISILDEIKESKKSPALIQEKLDKDSAREKAKEIISLSDRKKTLFDLISQNKNELARLEKWGDIDPEEFKAFSEK